MMALLFLLLQFLGAKFILKPIVTISFHDSQAEQSQALLSLTAI